MTMMPVFYPPHLKSQLSLAEYLFLKILIALLQSIKKVSLETLATALPLPILFESRRKRIQRFLSLPGLKIVTKEFPIVTTWLVTYFRDSQVIYLVIDRTSLGYINLFMISVVGDIHSFSNIL